jgi:hypothetical protein
MWDKHESTSYSPIDSMNNGDINDSIRDKNNSFHSSGDRRRKVENGRRLSSVVGYKAAPMNSQAILKVYI